VHEKPAGSGLFGADLWISRLFARLGRAVDPRESSRWATIVLAALVLLPPFVLGALSGAAWGRAVDIPFLKDVEALVRLLVVMPVLVLASRSVGAVLGAAMRYLEETSLVPDSENATYEDARRDLERRVRSRPVMGVILLLAILVSWFVFREWLQIGLVADRTNWIIAPRDGDLTMAGWWYVLVSRPVVNILILLWAWRYLCWCVFLLRLASIDLRILPAHPDQSGGLLPLARAHIEFVLVGFALNAALSGSIANELLYGTMTAAEARPLIAFFTILSVLMLAVPLAVFVPGLLRAKRGGIIEYGHLGHDLTQEFDERWRDGGHKLLDTTDTSAMADFGADYNLVRQLRSFPLGLHQVMAITVLLALPFAPLSLTQIELAELLKKLVGMAF
jgi:hypothetical protein